MPTDACSLEITSEDIEKAERLLSSDNKKVKFEDASKNVIKHLESCFVQACPGSGKTTTLVGKLAIFADKLPLNYEGICVLSHTNVAKDEVRKRLGSKADRLLKYPNFIGTIQSFVDRYLAIPAMIEKFGKRPALGDIDSSRFAYVLKKYLPRITASFLSRKYINFEDISYSFENIDMLNKEFRSSSEKEQGHYNSLVAKSRLVKSLGIITYEDAFALANWYLKQHPCIIDAISKRFPYVFVDEVQDTNEFQLKIIGTLFKKSKIQYFGDINQNLYNPQINVFDEIGKYTSTLHEKPILKTYRLSPAICKLSQHVCKEHKGDFQVNKYLCNYEECKQCGICNNQIILYNDSSIKDVLPLFARIIFEQKGKKHDEMGICYKAVGQVAKKTSKERDERTGQLNIVIPNYYNEFVNLSKNSIIPYYQMKNLKTAFLFIENHINNEKYEYKNFQTAKDILLRTLTKILEEQNNKKYSKTDLINNFKERNSLNKLYDFLFKCCDSIHRGKNNFDELKCDTIALLSPFFDTQNLKTETKTFLEGKACDINGENISKVENIFICPETNIKIEISTIAGIKGETHDATLLLETYDNGKDLARFLKFIANNSTKSEKDKLPERKLNNLYVAMTRPKHLLCLAMHQQGFDDRCVASLESLGWKINRELIAIQKSPAMVEHAEG